MKKALKITGWVVAALLAAAAAVWFGILKPKPPPVSDEDRARVTLMPLPAEMKLGNGAFILEESLEHQFTGLTTPRLEGAVERFYARLSARSSMQIGNGDGNGNGNGGSLVLECSGREMEYPSIEDDESYTIRITREKITVKAHTETGILYGLESLLQLLEIQNGQWGWPVLKLTDRPRYEWRGLMIDACRHWIPKDVILRNLDAMAALKMNVFHWHLTDNQAFRIESKRYPRLHEMGSNGDYYTQEEIREVVEYAADRGIRVVPEFDVPGHTTSWFAGHPELASGPGPYEPDSSMMGAQPVMDPTRDEVYEFLDRFFGEMAALFPDKYFHIGGDEVVSTQWNENSDIQQYMKTLGLEDPHALQAHFNTRLQKIVAKHGKKMMGWDEILHPDLPRGEIAVQTWRDHASLWEAARLGNEAVLSAGYYLDHKQAASYHYLVDPVVIQGAVEIEIDSLNWKGWECTMSVSSMVMDGYLYLFGEGENQRGILEFLDSPMGFTEVTTDEKNISFRVEGPVGEMEFKTRLDGDSISGSSKISVFNLVLNGKRSGGSDMPEGKPLPEFKKIEALNPEQEKYLIGGEACMWTEQVDSMTIDSRIWPRAAAIAEKLWSPKVLTDDTEDMYRRLMVLDLQLDKHGLMHRKYRRILLEDMVSESFRDPLRVLCEVLQEDLMFARMELYHPMLYTTTPLNRMVDAAPPESYVAYRFGQDVDLWIESKDAEAYERLISTLETWSVNHELLTPAFRDNERLMEVRAHSEHLSRLATLALEALSDPGSLNGRDRETEDLLASASQSHGATNLAIVVHVQKLLEAATKN